MRRLTFISCVVVLSGCASFPQTRDEFREAMRSSSSSLVFMDTYVSKRRFDDVVRTLRQKADECLQGDVTTTRTAGGITTMSQTDEYRTTVRLVDKNHAELTSQITMKGAILPEKMPPGGYYKAAVDIERITPTTTKLTY